MKSFLYEIIPNSVPDKEYVHFTIDISRIVSDQWLETLFNKINSVACHRRQWGHKSVL